MLKLRLKIKTFILLSLNLLMILMLSSEAQAEAVNRGGQTFETSTANDESSQKHDQNSKEISEADQNPVAAIMPKPGENLRRTLSEEETFKQQALVKLERAGIPNPTDEQIEEEIEKLKKELKESNEATEQTAVAAAPAIGGGSGGSGVGIGILAAGGIALAALAITSTGKSETPEIDIQTESLWSDSAFRSRAIDSYDYTYTDASGEPNLAQIDLFNDAKTRKYLENHGVKSRKGFWGDIWEDTSWERGVDEMIEENPDLPADQVARLRAMATSLDATDKMFAEAEDGDVDFYCQGGSKVQDHCKSFFDSVPIIANFVKAKQQVLQLESVSPENQGEDWKPALNKAKAQVNSFAAKLRAQANTLRIALDDQSSDEGKRLLQNVALLFESTAEKVAESNDRKELDELFKALDGKDWNDYVKAHEKFGLLESELSSEALRDATKATREIFETAMNPSRSYAELSTGAPGADEARHPSLGRRGSQGRVTPDGNSLDLRRASGGRL